MTQRFDGLNLAAIACALPTQTRPLEAFIPRFGESKVQRFRAMAGIEALPIAEPGTTASMLAEAAARRLIREGRLNPDEVDALLFISQTPDATAPATAALLQKRLGLPEHILALDLNGGCSGFLLGLLTAAHLLQHPTPQKILILGGDTLSRIVDPTDYTAAMLFGDAGFAALLTRGGNAPWHFLSATAGDDAITIPHGQPFHMDGTRVFNFTISRVPEQLAALLTACHAQSSDFDLLLLHQANAFIITQIARLLNLPPEKVPCRMARRGNTSSASLPLLLCDLAAEGLTGERNLLLSAFGVGLSWISAALPFNFANALPTQPETIS